MTPVSSSLPSPAYGSPAASTHGATMDVASAKGATASTGFTDKTAAPTVATSTAPPSTTVTLSPQALSMSHATNASSSSPDQAAAAPAAPASTSIYDDVKQGIVATVEGVGDAIGGTARFIGDGVASVVSGADALVHGALDLPFALGAEACNAAGAVLDAL